jgi:hypothetical protein
MESYSFTTIIEEPPPDMSWLIGRTIAKVVKDNCMWSFLLDDGSCVGTDSPWRLVMADGVVVTSEDDGHPFGLGAPVSAVERVMGTVAGRAIIEFEVRKGTCDLILRLPGEVWIEFLNLSCGYEAWGTRHGEQNIVCYGGGRLMEYRRG